MACIYADPPSCQLPHGRRRAVLLVPAGTVARDLAKRPVPCNGGDFRSACTCLGQPGGDRLTQALERQARQAGGPHRFGD